MGFAVEADPSLPPDVAQFFDPHTRQVRAMIVNAAPLRPPAPPPPPPIRVEGLHPLCSGCNGRGGYARPGGPGKCQVCNVRGAGEAPAEEVRPMRPMHPAASVVEAPPAVRPSDAAPLETSRLGEARLYGILKSIMEERGMEAAVLAVQRTLQDVAEAARAAGKGRGFIG